MTSQAKSDLVNTGYDAFFEALDNSSELCLSGQDVRDALLSAAEEHDYLRYERGEIVVYSDAWNIVTSSDLSPDEPVDFSGCTDSLQCVIAEANACTQAAISEGWYDALEEATDTVEELVSEAQSMGWEGDTITLTYHSNHGWAVHDRETESGICIYTKLDGECSALEASIGNIHCSVCWTPEA